MNKIICVGVAAILFGCGRKQIEVITVVAPVNETTDNCSNLVVKHCSRSTACLVEGVATEQSKSYSEVLNNNVSVIADYHDKCLSRWHSFVRQHAGTCSSVFYESCIYEINNNECADKPISCRKAFVY